MTARPIIEANSTRHPNCSRIGIRILTMLPGTRVPLAVVSFPGGRGRRAATWEGARVARSGGAQTTWVVRGRCSVSGVCISWIAAKCWTTVPDGVVGDGCRQRQCDRGWQAQRNKQAYAWGTERTRQRQAARPEAARHGRYSSTAGVAGAKRKDEQVALADEVADQACGKTDENLDSAGSDYACRIRLVGRGQQPGPRERLAAVPCG